MLNKATRDIVAAEQRYKEIKALHDKVRAFVRGTFNYVDAKRKLACHSLLVQWVLEQVPLVEAEMAQAETGKSRAKGKKRSLTPEEESPAGPSQKRQRVGEGSLHAGSDSNEPTQVTGSLPAPAQDQENANSPRPIKAIGKRSLPVLQHFNLLPSQHRINCAHDQPRKQRLESQSLVQV
ncbi:hypothetical protein ACHAPT_012796 [Fusarium lateritium]